jgi:hypothetical protein
VPGSRELSQATPPGEQLLQRVTRAARPGLGGQFPVLAPQRCHGLLVQFDDEVEQLARGEAAVRFTGDDQSLAVLLLADDGGDVLGLDATASSCVASRQ